MLSRLLFTTDCRKNFHRNHVEVQIKTAWRSTENIARGGKTMCCTSAEDGGRMRAPAIQRHPS